MLALKLYRLYWLYEKYCL